METGLRSEVGKVEQTEQPDKTAMGQAFDSMQQKLGTAKPATDAEVRERVAKILQKEKKDTESATGQEVPSSDDSEFGVGKVSRPRAKVRKTGAGGARPAARTGAFAKRALRKFPSNASSAPSAFPPMTPIKSSGLSESLFSGHGPESNGQGPSSTQGSPSVGHGPETPHQSSPAAEASAEAKMKSWFEEEGFANKSFVLRFQPSGGPVIFKRVG
jgi:hypothetical protein